MTEYEKLTLSFLQKHPWEAAQVLERLPVEDVAHFFEQVPARICSGVIDSMIPTASAKVFHLLSEDKRLTITRELKTQLTAHILRHSDKSTRISTLKKLPANLSIRIRMLLNYPQGSVGATMNPSVKVARTRQSVQDALDLLHDVTETEIAGVYIVDANQRLKGYVPVSDLVATSCETTLLKIMKPSPPALQARSSLSAAMLNPAWTNHLNLPVLDRDNKVIGELPLFTLSQTTVQSDEKKDENIGFLMANILDAYWTGWLSMLDIIFGHSNTRTTGK